MKAKELNTNEVLPEYENQYEGSENAEIHENTEADKAFLWNKKEWKEVGEVRERLEEKGIENIDLSDVKEIWQVRIAEAVESMCDSYPELEGYIGSIRTADLPEGVFACAGPKMTGEGYFTEIQLNRQMFSKSNLELKIVDAEMENFRGEKWLAGRGVDGVLKHEMAHILHLRLLAEKEGLNPGEKDMDKYRNVTEGYQRNFIMNQMCYDTIKELGISARDIGKHLSTYGASNFGEFFAEAISEYETAKNPRVIARTIHEKYQEMIVKEREIMEV